MRTDGKRSLLYRIFFKSPATNQPLRNDNVVPHTELAPRIPGMSITLVIKNEDSKAIKEMTSFPFAIGREYSEGGIQLDKKSVSRRHAAIDMQGRNATITDENSSNGVEVSGRRLVPGQPYILKCGDDINIGGVMVSVMDIRSPSDLFLSNEAPDGGDNTQLLFPWQTPPPANEPPPSYDPPPYNPPPSYDPPPAYNPPPSYDSPPPNASGASSPPSVFCTACGRPNNAGENNFCIGCGSRLVKPKQ